jgi:hypothetical protein
MEVNGKSFPVVAGIVQFDPRHREVNGQLVRDVKVREFGTQRETWITIWPEHGHVPLAKGDFVVVQGKRRIWEINDSDGQPRLYECLDARTLVHTPAVARTAVESSNF